MESIPAVPPKSHEEETKEVIVVLDTQMILLEAYAQAGEISRPKELAEILGTIGKSDPDDMVATLQERRQLEGFESDEEQLNSLQQEIVRMLELRREYDEDCEEVKALREYGKRQMSFGVPPVMDRLRSMISTSFDSQGPPIEASEEAKELASDVFWMLHRLKASQKEAAA